jgi:SAM-dependent methyltransferase
MVVTGEAANEAERHRWNDDRWTQSWPQREVLTSGATALLVEALAPHPAERILDIGSGGGGLTLAVADKVGPRGLAVGVDVSRSLSDLARQRGSGFSVVNTRFVVADMQTEDVAGGPFDAAVSQFGVMFFDEPVSAFTNIRTHLRPGGRLAFACWCPVEDNPWHTAVALRPFVPAPPVAAAGKSLTGPFTLGDRGRTESILRDAGFAAIDCTRHQLVVEAPLSGVYDQSLLGMMGVKPEHTAEAHTTVLEYLSRFRDGSGHYRFPLSFQIITAVSA